MKTATPTPNPTEESPLKAAKMPAATALPAALRHFYAPQTTHAPIADSDKWAAVLPLLMSKTLEQVNALVSLALSCTINPNGAVTVTTSPTQPATAYEPYIAVLTNTLNDNLPVELNHFAQFRLAPTTVDFAIHALPLHVPPLSNQDLSATMKQAIRYASNGVVDINSARYLVPDPSNRLKPTSSVVVAVSLAKSTMIPSSINLFSCARKCECMVSTNAATQCRNCQKFGHIAVRCKQEFPSCPFCNLRHTRAAHWCGNSGCEKGGNDKPVPGCFGVFLLHYANCGTMHVSTSPTCPIRIEVLASLHSRFATTAAPPPPPVEEEPTETTLPANDPMNEDTAADGGRI